MIFIVLLLIMIPLKLFVIANNKIIISLKSSCCQQYSSYWMHLDNTIISDAYSDFIVAWKIPFLDDRKVVTGRTWKFYPNTRKIVKPNENTFTTVDIQDGWIYGHPYSIAFKIIFYIINLFTCHRFCYAIC